MFRLTLAVAFLFIASLEARKGNFSFIHLPTSSLINPKVLMREIIIYNNKDLPGKTYTTKVIVRFLQSKPFVFNLS